MAQENLRVALFLLGGAANGKSAIVHTRFSTEKSPIEGLPFLPLERWCDPDREKLNIPMYTPERGDAQARKRFGSETLGGPSGPRNRAEYNEYPEHIRVEVENFVQTFLGFDNVADFANQWLEEENPEGAGSNFGGGLTHELSKAIAQRRLHLLLQEHPPKGPFVWDAVGNADAYISWIEEAFEAGYTIEIVYVYCDLAVAQMRASNRKSRKILPKLVKSTYYKAADAAQSIKEFIDSCKPTDRLNFTEACTDDEAERMEALTAGFTEDGSLS